MKIIGNSKRWEAFIIPILINDDIFDKVKIPLSVGLSLMIGNIVMIEIEGKDVELRVVEKFYSFDNSYGNGNPCIIITAQE